MAFYRSSLSRSRSFGYLQPSTRYTWSLNFSQQAKPRDARPHISGFGLAAQHAQSGQPDYEWPCDRMPQTGYEVPSIGNIIPARPFDPKCRYSLPVPNSESAHVRRTLLAAVEYGGDTSHASLYFSCQCAGLDGNPVAICAVSRRMNLTIKVGVFFKRETAQIATALVGGSLELRVKNYERSERRSLRSLWFPKVDFLTVGQCRSKIFLG